MNVTSQKRLIIMWSCLDYTVLCPGSQMFLCIWMSFHSPDVRPWIQTEAFKSSILFLFFGLKALMCLSVACIYVPVIPAFLFKGL